MFVKIIQLLATWMTKLLLSLTVNDSAWITQSVNSDLQRIRNWCFNNCSMLNPDKTKLIVFGSRRMSSKLLDFKLSPQKTLTRLNQSKTFE